MKPCCAFLRIKLNGALTQTNISLDHKTPHPSPLFKFLKRLITSTHVILLFRDILTFTSLNLTQNNHQNCNFFKSPFVENIKYGDYVSSLGSSYKFNLILI